MSTRVKIAAAQIDVALGQVHANLLRIEDIVAVTARAGAKLVVFPECALTGYCFNSLEEALPYAQPVPGPATDRLTVACIWHDVHVIVGMLEREGDRLYNTAVLIGPSGVVGRYRKVHLPYLGVDRFTTPGDGFSVWDAGSLKVGMNICYDGAFPEASRVMALQGADLICLPTNWPPGAETTADYVINTRALENNVYYLAVNRVGEERGFRFIGRSRICAPNGQTLAEAAHDQEMLLYATIEPEVARDKHIVRVPDLHELDRFGDRRPDTYGLITVSTGREGQRLTPKSQLGCAGCAAPPQVSQPQQQPQEAATEGCNGHYDDGMAEDALHQQEASHA